jgi:hypothetical protein
MILGMNLKTIGVYLMVGIYVALTVLLFHGFVFEDFSSKPLTEGVLIALSVLSVLAAALLMRKSNVKNVLIFDVCILLIFLLSVVSMVFYVREENLDKGNKNYPASLALLGVGIFISGLILLDDVLNMGIGLGATVKA